MKVVSKKTRVYLAFQSWKIKDTGDTVKKCACRNVLMAVIFEKFLAIFGNHINTDIG